MGTDVTITLSFFLFFFLNIPSSVKAHFGTQLGQFTSNCLNLYMGGLSGASSV